MKHHLRNLTAATLTCAAIGGGAPSSAQAEPMLGEVKFFAGDFPPRGWELCDGQLLQIEDNIALFSILGTTYGGDGRTTFGLPNMLGRSPMHAGSGPGLPTVRLGAENDGTTTQDPALIEGTQNTEFGTAGTPVVGLNCIIAVLGLFPSRS